MNSNQVLGMALMVAGVILIIVVVFRSLGHVWTWGLYDVWVLPVIAVVLIVVGRWLLA